MPRRNLATLALALALIAVPGAAKKSRDPDLKEWIDGPIRYIAQKAETREFRSLETDADRILYIERFWALRDPHPETMTNEYRQLFWERVREANSLFLDSPHDGWRTDRGKIHILYGPPTEVEEDLDYHPDSPTATGGLIRWIYDGRAEGRTDVDPVTIIPFVRSAGGEYRLSYDPKLSTAIFAPRQLRMPWEDETQRWLEITGPPTRSELSVMLDLGRMQEVPPQAQVLLERIETREAYVTHEVSARTDRFDHPDRDGEWLVTVSVDVSHTSGREAPAVIARLRPATATLEDASPDQRILEETSFKVVDVGDQRVAQARIVLLPGVYEMTVLVADPDTAQTGLLRRELRLGTPSERLRFSDVVQALELESLRYRALSSYDEPYTVGPFRVVPRFGNAYLPGETVRLFYEVYRAALPVKVSYQVQGREDDGRWTDLGLPAEAVQEHRAQAWELPTSQHWPIGEYRVRVEVTDADGKLISTDVPFELVAERAPLQPSEEPSVSEQRSR
jgi:GWxTD domain-containing protein